MKMTDIHGKPILNNHEALTRQLKDEGLDEIDLEELYLLDDTCGDGDDDDWDWGLDLWGFEEALQLREDKPEPFSCYDDGEL
jgi:hypothetical protein